MTERIAILRIRRGTAGDEPRYQEFAVPFEDGASVLDALIWIRNRQDPSLAPLVEHGAYRPHDADIAGAAAQISAQSDADETLIGLRQPQHEIARGDQHSRRAVTALQRMFTREGRTEL